MNTYHKKDKQPTESSRILVPFHVHIIPEVIMLIDRLISM
jgi:hypothetical protein